MGKVITVCQQKGGVGKTTTTANVGAALHQLGKRVLMVDTDPQGSLSVMFGLNPDEFDVALYEVLDSKSLPLASIVKSIKPGLDIIPSNIHLAKANFTLVGRYHREEILRGKLRPLQSEYDYILIDCPPDLNVLTLNALTAADSVIIPVQTQFLSLRGMKDLRETIDDVREHGNPRLKIIGIVPTMYDGTNHAKEVIETLQTQFPGQVMEPIKRRKDFSELAYAGQTFFDRDRKSDADIISAYKSLAQEVMNRA